MTANLQGLLSGLDRREPRPSGQPPRRRPRQRTPGLDVRPGVGPGRARDHRAEGLRQARPARRRGGRAQLRADPRVPRSHLLQSRAPLRGHSRRQAQPGLHQISRHENAHVAFLRKTLGSQAVAKPAFDFTAGGAFGTVQELRGVHPARAGLRGHRRPGLQGTGRQVDVEDAFSQARYRIDSVEARHASMVRRLAQSPGEKGWITLANNTVAALDPVYAGEDVTTQAGVDLTTFGSAGGRVGGVRRAADQRGSRGDRGAVHCELKVAGCARGRSCRRPPAREPEPRDRPGVVSRPGSKALVPHRERYCPSPFAHPAGHDLL